MRCSAATAAAPPKTSKGASEQRITPKATDFSRSGRALLQFRLSESACTVMPSGTSDTAAQE